MAVGGGSQSPSRGRTSASVTRNARKGYNGEVSLLAFSGGRDRYPQSWNEVGLSETSTHPFRQLLRPRGRNGARQCSLELLVELRIL